MERTDQRQDENLTIDLGAVTTETKGPGPVGLDFYGLEIQTPGIADD